MDITKFLKSNVKEEGTFEFAPTKRFCDEEGKAIPWVFKKLSINEYERIREECTSINFADKGKTKFNNYMFNKKIICNSVVEPNLNNAELQDSYGVKKAEDLITELFENAGEYYNLLGYLLEVNGFKSVGEYAEEAKN
ncbi:MAG: hypothetical protein Q4F63_02930 [Clostridia bacterium]|nr:hypothetical protein [Clostridia bacterium]